MNKPVLFDQIVNSEYHCHTQVDGKWYIAREISFYSCWTIFERIYHAWLVITNKAIAVQYAEDFYKK
jgi:hypothetical protein